MRYGDFIERLDIHPTSEGRGKGVRCNLTLYVYPDGHGNIYGTNDDGTWTLTRKRQVTTPTNNLLETVDTLIDVLYVMHREAKRVGRSRKSRR